MALHHRCIQASAAISNRSLDAEDCRAILSTMGYHDHELRSIDMQEARRSTTLIQCGAKIFASPRVCGRMQSVPPARHWHQRGHGQETEPDS